MSAIPDTFEVMASKSNYTKLTVGKHRLRVLGDAISGFVYWEDTADGGRRPTRLKDDAPIPVEHAEDVRRFLAMPVWNYAENKIQIWEVTQASIQKELKAYDRDPDWGSLTDYDIEVERTGLDKMTTKYRVSTKPKSVLSKEIVKAVEAGLPVLAALYVNQDPFTYNPDAAPMEEVDTTELDNVFRAV